MGNVILFSQEELIYLLRTLSLPDLPGMGEKPWGHIPQEQALLVMETVGRGLVARQVIEFGEASMKVDEYISRLLQTCAGPRQMLVINYRLRNETVSRNFFRGQEFDVENDLPYPWVHRFEIVEKSDMGRALLQSLLKDAPDCSDSAVFEIAQADLNEVQQNAANDPDQAAQILQSKGLPGNEAGRLARAFASPTLKIMVMAFWQMNPEAQGIVFSLLANHESTWLIKTDNAGEAVTQVMTIGKSKLQEFIQAELEKFG